MSKKPKVGEQVVCTNRKARWNYEIEDTLEMGLVLLGSEVKSLRENGGDLEGAYATFSSGELWLHHMHIPPYEQAHLGGHDPRARRKLLAKSQQIEKLQGKLSIRGYALVPIRVYFKRGWAKVEVGLGRGKKNVDRREDLKKKAAVREARDALRRTGHHKG